jgi:selenocysteine lyase/cysteine desulfurase
VDVRPARHRHRLQPLRRSQVRHPIIPTFSEATAFSTTMTPGGYHSFEHRWALDEAFKLHLELGKADVEARIHALNSYLKQRLQQRPQIELVTPLSPELSAGFTFFRVKGKDSDKIAAHLMANRWWPMPCTATSAR